MILPELGVEAFGKVNRVKSRRRFRVDRPNEGLSFG